MLFLLASLISQNAHGAEVRPHNATSDATRHGDEKLGRHSSIITGLATTVNEQRCIDAPIPLSADPCGIAFGSGPFEGVPKRL